MSDETRNETSGEMRNELRDDGGGEMDFDVGRESSGQAGSHASSPMKPLASLPVAVVMQRRVLQHRWADEAWAAVAVVVDSGGLPPLQPLAADAERQSYLVSGLTLELFGDENEGYHENWLAPESKVFVMWRMQAGQAMPLRASVSYAEGTRMFDSGEAADGVVMPADIHAWLGAYLRQHYTPRAPGGEQRHGKRART